MTYFIFMTMLYHLFEYQFVIKIRWVMLSFLVFYLLIVTRNDAFINVIKFYVPLMIIVIIGLLYSYVNFKSAGVNMIISGIFISFIAAGVQQSGIVLHKHMNYNDIAHFIQMFAIWYFYRGSLVLKDAII